MVTWDDRQTFHELDAWRDDRELVALIRSCVEQQQQAACEFREQQFRPVDSEQVDEMVSEHTLSRLLDRGEDVNGISSQREISNVIVFNAQHISGAVNNQDLVLLRRQIDLRINQKVLELFPDVDLDLWARCSGHFWYPPGSFMSWHTNSSAPGWRIYITYTKEPSKSFFRYRLPHTGEIVTSHDSEFDVRMFRVTKDAPLWHCVASRTDRFSIGYVIREL